MKHLKLGNHFLEHGKVLSLLSCLFLGTSFASAANVKGATGGTNYYVDNRRVYVYAPNNIQANRPLLISMHGRGQDVNYQKEHAQWELVADTANFVVAYPQGNNNSWDISGSSDLKYLVNVIKKVSEEYQIDETRVYLSGFSMGGMMTYHAMNNISDYFAAFAPVSGYLFGSTTPNPSIRPLPLMHTHGTSDDVVNYNGVTSVIDAWQKHNNCQAKETSKINNCATRTTYSGGDCGADVVLNSLPNKGHWHSNDEACMHSSREIWRFVSRYSTKCATIPDVPQTPFNGTPAVLPGKIEAEEFDFGGEGKAYHDMDRDNRNGGDRKEGVDMSNTAIGYTQKGEWLKYTVKVEKGGLYEMSAYVASGADASSFQLYIDDEPITGEVAVPNTGDWSTYTTVTESVGTLTEGEHVLKLAITGDWVDIDYLRFAPANTTGVASVESNSMISNGEYAVYDILGARLKNCIVVDGDINLDRGIYLLKNLQTNKVVKVVVSKNN